MTKDTDNKIDVTLKINSRLYADLTMIMEQFPVGLIGEGGQTGIAFFKPETPDAISQRCSLNELLERSLDELMLQLTIAYQRVKYL